MIDFEDDYDDGHFVSIKLLIVINIMMMLMMTEMCKVFSSNVVKKCLQTEA